MQTESVETSWNIAFARRLCLIYDPSLLAKSIIDSHIFQTRRSHNLSLRKYTGLWRSRTFTKTMREGETRGKTGFDEGGLPSISFFLIFSLPLVNLGIWTDHNWRRTSKLISLLTDGRPLLDMCFSIALHTLVGETQFRDPLSFSSSSHSFICSQNKRTSILLFTSSQLLCNYFVETVACRKIEEEGLIFSSNLNHSIVVAVVPF